MSCNSSVWKEGTSRCGQMATGCCSRRRTCTVFIPRQRDVHGTRSCFLGSNGQTRCFGAIRNSWTASTSLACTRGLKVNARPGPFSLFSAGTRCGYWLRRVAPPRCTTGFQHAVDRCRSSLPFSAARAVPAARHGSPCALDAALAPLLNAVASTFSAGVART